MNLYLNILQKFVNKICIKIRKEKGLFYKTLSAFISHHHHHHHLHESLGVFPVP